MTDVFIANAVICVSVLGILTIFYWQTRIDANKVKNYLIVLGMTLVLIYALAIERMGFNAEGLYDARDLSFLILDVLFFVTGLIFTGVTFLLGWHIFKEFEKVARGIK